MTPLLTAKFAADAITCRSRSILKIQIPAKLFIAQIFCGSWSAAERITCACCQQALLEEARNDAPGFAFVVTNAAYFARID